MSNKVGRPTKYRDSVANAICIRLMNGESLNEICKRESYPGKATVYAWLIKHDEFQDKYCRAREIQQENHLDEMLEIADDATNDWMERNTKEGDFIGWQINGEHVQRSKLRIDTRKWIMERMSPTKYGDKKSVDLSSKDGSMTPKRSVDMSKLSEKALREIANAGSSPTDTK